MSFQDILGLLKGSDAGSLLLLLIVIGSALVEVAPIKINPWSWLAKMVGRAINGEMMAKISTVQGDIKALDQRVTTLQENTDKREADAARRDILNFADELLHYQQHSKDSYDNILIRCSEYEAYCKAHPDYLNHVTKRSIELITKEYDRHMAEDSFLA